MAADDFWLWQGLLGNLDSIESAAKYDATQAQRRLAKYGMDETQKWAAGTKG
jgi:hypothetical protein